MQKTSGASTRRNTIQPSIKHQHFWHLRQNGQNWMSYQMNWLRCRKNVCHLVWYHSANYECCLRWLILYVTSFSPHFTIFVVSLILCDITRSILHAQYLIRRKCAKWQEVPLSLCFPQTFASTLTDLGRHSSFPWVPQISSVSIHFARICDTRARTPNV